MASKTNRARKTALTKDRDKSSFSIFVRLFTNEKFPLKNITNDMKVRDLKMYMEFATGVPVHMQRISYLDEGELLDHTDIRSNDIVAGATLNMTVWQMWKDLIEACSTNDMDWVFRLGVTQPTSYHTPGSDYMTKRARKAWLQERAFLALYVASHRGHENLVRKLIESGADVNASTPLGRTALHVAASQGHGHIVDLLLEHGADIDAEDDRGQTALTIAASFGHKTCERHLFLFRWQQRAKRTKPSKEPARMAHQYYDSALPVWKKGGKCQLYFMNILPPGEYEGTRFGSPKRMKDLTAEELEELEAIGTDGKLPAIREGKKQRAKRSTKGGPARLGKRGGLSYDEWLGRKLSFEQKIIDEKRGVQERKKFEEDERKSQEDGESRKRQEAEKSESYETWLANKETEKRVVPAGPVTAPIQGPPATTSIPRQPEMDTSDRSQEMSRADGYLRTYLKSLDERKRGNSYFSYENWLDEKEETILGLRRQKTTFAN
ncbi:ankyrin repeat and SAM domain-containing protein 4B-like isoform X2 [Mya arenaria]|uniref:ankyrin repeat and SAM domain-containing protein 4B-like isoform X2 n=1 Tax=Mya arenaria TaxID=6604 RepID=UPI0022E8DD75|nr:ankyrin repeat and SAM domain-containing protein 4B-like isoform X2 [Mya arenaria]